MVVNSFTFVVENVILKALYCAVLVMKSFTFVVETYDEGSVLCCESTN